MSTIGFLLAAALALGAPAGGHDAHVGYSFIAGAPYGAFSGFEPASGGIGGFVLAQQSRSVASRPGRVLDVPAVVVAAELGLVAERVDEVQAICFGALVPVRPWLALYGGPGLAQRERFGYFAGLAPDDDVYTRESGGERLSFAAGVLLRLKPAFVQVGAVSWPAAVSVGMGVLF